MAHAMLHAETYRTFGLIWPCVERTKDTLGAKSLPSVTLAELACYS